MNAGEFLKTKRQEKQLSLQDVSFALKINPRVLKAIEDNIQEDLPAPAISKGFIKSYAKFLKVSQSEELQALVDSEFGLTHYRSEDLSREFSEGFVSPEKTSPRDTNLTKAISEAVQSTLSGEKETVGQAHKNSFKTPLLLILAGCILLMIIGVQKIIEKYQRDSSLATGSAITEEAQPTTDSATTNSENISAAVPVLSNNLNNAPATEAPMTEQSDEPTASAAAQTNTNPITATNNPTPPATAASPAAAAVAKPEQNTTASPTTVTVKEEFKLQNVEVIVEAKGDVEISYASKVSQIGKVKLQSGQIHVFKSKNGLKLNISDGSLVRTAVNGIDKGSASSLNKPVTIVY